jgi:hypothetical protein
VSRLPVGFSKKKKRPAKRRGASLLVELDGVGQSEPGCESLTHDLTIRRRDRPDFDMAQLRTTNHERKMPN